MKLPQVRRSQAARQEPGREAPKRKPWSPEQTPLPTTQRIQRRKKLPTSAFLRQLFLFLSFLRCRLLQANLQAEPGFRHELSLRRGARCRSKTRLFRAAGTLYRRRHPFAEYLFFRQLFAKNLFFREFFRESRSRRGQTARQRSVKRESGIRTL